MKQARFVVLKLSLVMAVLCISPLYGTDARSEPININLIIDGSDSLASVKEDMTTWITSRLDNILVDGDRVTIWSAGPAARVIYSGSMNNQNDREAAKRSIRELSGSGQSSDFSGALSQAAAQQTSGFCYTLLICASPAMLSTILSGPQANLLRFSMIENFSGWRAIVVGLNLDTRVRNAASAFMGS